ncbi:unnamed protein product [Allacma fusca]|uniref:Uncharacterized protein n=1 Tax=Allacma fusca TaxID=39272 RepID=A0A8J2KUB9_9HEXA|nr:unnamed protein product [Allacma fusca]
MDQNSSNERFSSPQKTPQTSTFEESSHSNPKSTITPDTFSEKEGSKQNSANFSDERKILHEEVKRKTLEHMTDILRKNTYFQFEDSMTEDFKVMLGDRLEKAVKEFLESNKDMTASHSNAEFLQQDEIISKILQKFDISKIKALGEISAKRDAPINTKNFLEGNQLDSLIQDNHPNIVDEKLDQLVEEKLSKLLQEDLGHLVEEKLPQIAQEKLGQLLKDNLSKIVQDVGKLVEEKLSDIVQEKLDKQLENKVSKLVNEKTAIIVDQHLKLLKEFEGINDRFNTIRKENLHFQANAESVDNTLTAIQNDFADVVTKINNMKDDNETNVQILKNRLEEIQNEHKSSNDYIKSVPEAIKNVKGDYSDVVTKLEKLESNMKTLNEIENNQKTVIADLIQKLQSSEATVQKLQLQLPSLEHPRRNQESGTKLPSTQNTSAAAKSTNSKPWNYKPKTKVFKTYASTVPKPLNGGLAKNVYPEHNNVAGNANGHHMKQGVNSGVPKLQQRGQVTTGKVTGSERQTLVSRNSTTKLVLEKKRSQFMFPNVKDRKTLLFEANNKPKSSETQLQQKVKSSTDSKSKLPRSISAYSVYNFK